MYTPLVQKLYLFLLVGLFLTWQVLTHPVYSESHVQALIRPTLESSGPAVLDERGNICLPCGPKNRGGQGEGGNGRGEGSSRSGNSIELQPHNNNGNPAAIGAADQAVLRLYSQAERNHKNFVQTGHSKFWKTELSQGQVYSTGVCYGCTVVVVASGRGVYLIHFAEDVGTTRVFANPTSEEFERFVAGRFEDEIHANKWAFENQQPYMVVATPSVSFDASELKYPAAVRSLGESFGRVVEGGATMRTQGYRIRTMMDTALEDTAAGKVVVQWLPPSDGGDARLIVHVEDNVVVDAHYNGRGQLVS